MNVLFIARSTLYSAPGGDTIQIQSTAKYLCRLGFHIDIVLANQSVDYSTYDLLHFFNITRPADILKHVKLSGKPFVISPIFIDYSEFERIYQTGWVSFLRRFLSNDETEYLKVIARFFKNGEKINSYSYLWRGQRRSIKYLLQRANYLLPNSESEYKRLYNKYQIQRPYVVVPNAIDKEKFASTISTIIRETDLVLCVARIEGIKNQLNLIKALNNSSFRLMIVGKPAPNHLSYYQSCVEIAGSNVQFIDHIPQEKLIPLYRKAHIHVLPSWFETTGLASLEAAAMGCKIVITDKGDTREYFQDYAHYCNPADPDSIRAAIESAASSVENSRLREHILSHLTWENAAQKTQYAYCKIINTSE